MASFALIGQLLVAAHRALVGAVVTAAPAHLRTWYIRRQIRELLALRATLAGLRPDTFGSVASAINQLDAQITRSVNVLCASERKTLSR